MRLVAGSNPATRTINHQPKEKLMSYHGYPPYETYEKTGMGVVNPLRRIEQKLKKIRDLLEELPDDCGMSAVDLKTRLLEALDD